MLKPLTFLCHIVLAWSCASCSRTTDSATTTPSNDRPAAIDARTNGQSDRRLASIEGSASEDSAVQSFKSVIHSVPGSNETFAFLKALLRDVRLVQLGSASEFAEEGLSVVRYLHEQLRFNVIAFEAPFFPCWNADATIADSSAVFTMHQCLEEEWRKEALRPLFDYLRSQRRAGTPLHLIGIDVRSRSAHGITQRPAFLYNVLARVDTSVAAEAFSLDSTVVADALSVAKQAMLGGSAISSRAKQIADYRLLERWLSSQERAFLSAKVPVPQMRVARQLVRSEPISLILPAVVTPLSAASIRARGMADNLDFVLDSLDAGERIIVWSHNDVVRYAGTTSVGQRERASTLGSFMAERRRTQTYTVGFLAGDSSARLQQQDYVNSRTTDRRTLEALVLRANLSTGFVDLHQWRARREGAFLDSAVTTGIVGTHAQSLELLREYDALVFVDHHRASQRIAMMLSPLCCTR